VVEATAYFAVAEALACVAEHADATEAVVQVAEAGDELLVEVCDDGSGAAGPVERLRAVGERVRAAGGTLAVESPPGGGTVVRAALPLDPWVRL
jgi:signal transduction histidine kinase